MGRGSGGRRGPLVVEQLAWEPTGSDTYDRAYQVILRGTAAGSLHADWYAEIEAPLARDYMTVRLTSLGGPSADFVVAADRCTCGERGCLHGELVARAKSLGLRSHRDLVPMPFAIVEERLGNFRLALAAKAAWPATVGPSRLDVYRAGQSWAFDEPGPNRVVRVSVSADACTCPVDECLHVQVLAWLKREHPAALTALRSFPTAA